MVKLMPIGVCVGIKIVNDFAYNRKPIRKKKSFEAYCAASENLYVYLLYNFEYKFLMLDKQDCP